MCSMFPFSKNFYRGRFHCVKTVQIRSFFWSVFSSTRTEYGYLQSKSPCSVRIQENKDQKKLRIWINFTQCSLEWKTIKFALGSYVQMCTKGTNVFTNFSDVVNIDAVMTWKAFSSVECNFGILEEKMLEYWT